MIAFPIKVEVINNSNHARGNILESWSQDKSKKFQKKLYEGIEIKIKIKIKITKRITIGDSNSINDYKQQIVEKVRKINENCG